MSLLELGFLAAALFATGTLATFVATALLNALTFPRLGAGRASDPSESQAPAAPTVARVSILIPARDEASAIGATVEDLLRGAEAPLELLVLDDGSTDGTSEVVRSTAARIGGPAGSVPGRDGLVRVLAGTPLPPGWAGKPWACRQLAEAARGEWLLFTDADTRWAPGALEALVAEAGRTDADLLTVWPTQTTVSWAERLTVPLIALTVLAYLPAVAAHALPYPFLAAANGQCLLFRRSAYEAIGGHESVAGTVLDDVALGRRIKAQGLRLRMADGAGLVGCRMYRDWPSVRDGFGKNIAAGFGGTTGLVLSTLFHWLVFLGPWAWLLLGSLAPAGSVGAAAWPWWPLALAAAGLFVRAVTAAATRQRVADALLMPVSALAMTLVAFRALAWARSGGPRWKGRTVPR